MTWHRPLLAVDQNNVPGLKRILIRSLTPPNPEPPSLQTAIKLDEIWLASYLVTDMGYCLSWSGSNQTVCQGKFEISKIDILPFVNHDPTHPDTLYSALSFIQNAAVKYRLGAVPVTFDQPLYIKAADTVASSPDLTNKFVRLVVFI